MKKEIKRSDGRQDFTHALGLLKAQMLSSGKKEQHTIKPGDALSKVGESMKEPDAVSQGMSGLLQGIGGGINIAYQAQQNKRAESQEAKITSQIEELLQWNKSMSERRQALEESDAAHKQAVENLLPRIGGVLTLASQGAAEQKAYMSNLLGEYGNLTGKKLTLASFDPTQPLTPTIKDMESGEEFSMDLMSFARTQGYDKLVDDWNNKTPDAISKSIDEQKKRAVELEKTQQDMKVQNERLALDQQKFEAEQGKDSKEAIKLVEEELKAAKSAEEELNTLKRMEKILNNKKDDGTVGVMRQLAESMTPGHVAENRRSPDQAEFSKLSSDLKGSIFKRNQFRNQAEFENIQVPSPERTPEANLQMIKEQKAALEPIVAQKQALEAKLKGVREGPSASSTSMINIKGPDGTTRPLPSNIAEQFLTKPGFSRA